MEQGWSSKEEPNNNDDSVNSSTDGNDTVEFSAPEDIFARIEALASLHNENVAVEKSFVSNDLQKLKIEDYDQVKIDPNTDHKIKELKRIIETIEKKPPVTIEINLDKQYKIDYKKELNDPQLLAVTTANGPVLVIAGAGSGKTRIIVYRVLFMLENGIPPSDILLLTFTRKAAKEMLDRVKGLLPEKGSHNIFGGTFHAFSNHILRKYSNSILGHHSNFNILDDEDAADAIDLIRTEFKVDKSDRMFPKKNRIKEIISSARNRNLSIGDIVEGEFSGLKKYVGTIQLIYEGYSKYKRSAKLVDYDDLMEVLRDALRDNIEIRKKLQDTFRYIMVDEYQDTNLIQKEIVDYLAGPSQNLMVVGDDSQSIYAFRGANYENILRFPHTYPNCKVIKIEQNYRSNQAILNFTNEIIQSAQIGYKKKLHSDIASTSVPAVRKFFDQETEACFIVDKVIEYREQGIALNQIAVLVRAFWHARYIEAELNRRRIPYIAVGGLKFNEKKHVKDVISYLRIIHNPYDAISWHRVLKYLPKVGRVTAGKIIQEIITPKGFKLESFGSKSFSPDLARLTAMLNEAMSEGKCVSNKVEIIRNYYAPILQANEEDYQIRLLDIGVLIDLASKYDSVEKFLTEFALDPPSKKFGDKTVPLIDEGEDKPLVISTIHSAKGLEWRSVFIPHALDGLIPSIRSMANIEDLEEERRLFYVACSRAKEDLHITMPSVVSTYNAFLSYPSRFLVEIDKSRFHYQ